VLEAKIQGEKGWEEDVSSYWMTLRKRERMLEIRRGSTRSHIMENSLWKRL
jgi:hypothetical protein